MTSVSYRPRRVTPGATRQRFSVCPAAIRSATFGRASRRRRAPASSGASAAIARRALAGGRGATATSARSCSIALTTPAATSLRGRGARARAARLAPESANIPASRMKPGQTTETPTPVPAQVGAQRRARSRAGRTWSRSRARRGPRRLARERGDEDQVPGAALASSPGTSSRAMQHRRLEVDPQRAADLLLARSSSSRPDAGRPALATRHVDLARLARAAARAAPGSARSADDRAVPVAGQRAGELARAPRALRELSTSVAPRPASASAIARPRPPVAPVSRTVLPAELHAQNLNGYGSARDEALRLLGHLPDAAPRWATRATTPTSACGRRP